MSKIRIMMIEQQESVYDQIKYLLKDESHIEIIKFANSREKGFKLLEKLQPDIALIDIYFIKESDWSESLLQSLPVLILARPLVDEVAKTLRAISLGAIDFINKKDLCEKDFKKELIFKINNAYKRKQEKVNKRPKLPKLSKKKQQYKLSKKVQKDNEQKTIIAIGTSTGGPKALQKLLEKLPKDFSVPIFVVQHMPSGFTKSLAERLNQVTDLNIKEAIDGEIVEGGTVYIAPGNYHLTVLQKGNQLVTHIHQGDLHRGHRPSVDILFQSIAKIKNINKIAVILTGMGKDGAEGVKAIKTHDESALIIAESEKSAVIFGMPQAALATESVTNVAHINEIGKMIKEYVER